MKNLSFLALVSPLLATLLSCSAVAQTRYCIGGDLDHLSAAERASCSAAKDLVKGTATRLHAPEDWHFIVVCGEEGWKDYTAVAQRGNVALEDSAADTDLTLRVTYLRESRLRAPQPQELQRVVAHELASIESNTHDERVIAAQIAVWSNVLNANNDTVPANNSTRKTKLPIAAAGM